MADEATTLGVADLSGPEDTARRPRRKRWLIIAAIVVMVVAVPTGVFLYNQHRLRQAEQHLAEVKASLSFKLVPAKDLPMLWGPPPAPEDNAAPLYDLVAAKFDELFVDRDDCPTRLKHEYDLLCVAWGLLDAAEYDEETDEEIAPPVPPRDVARAERFFDEVAERIALRNRIVARKGYREKKDWSQGMSVLLPQLYDAWCLAELTDLEAEVAADAGRWDDAYQSVATILTMADHLDQQPVLAEVWAAADLRRKAIETLAGFLDRAAPSESLSEKLTALLTVNGRDLLRKAIITECVTKNGIVEDLLAGRGGPGPTGKAIPVPSGRLRVSILNAQAVILEAFGDLVRAAEKPAPECNEECLRIVCKLDVKAEAMGGIGDRLLGLAMTNMVEIPYVVHEEAAQCCLARVAIHLAKHRQTHDAYPETLAETSFAGKVTSDSFSDTELRYRREGEGFVLWSVGLDGDDDGGKTNEELTTADPGTDDDDGDIVFRVPPVDEASGESSSE